MSKNFPLPLQGEFVEFKLKRIRVNQTEAGEIFLLLQIFSPQTGQNV